MPTSSWFSCLQLPHLCMLPLFCSTAKPRCQPHPDCHEKFTYIQGPCEFRETEYRGDGCRVESLHAPLSPSLSSPGPPSMTHNPPPSLCSTFHPAQGPFSFSFYSKAQIKVFPQQTSFLFLREMLANKLSSTCYTYDKLPRVHLACRAL